jgi:rubrerythrin
MMTTTRHIDFARLSLKDALDLAVLIEQEAEERYEELHHQALITRELAKLPEADGRPGDTFEDEPVAL